MIEKVKNFFKKEEYFDIDGAIESLQSEFSKAKVDYITMESALEDQIQQQNDFFKVHNGDFAIENIRLITDRLDTFRKSQDSKILEIQSQIDELEKSRKHAQLGDIREWHDGKYQKTTRGWIKITHDTKQKDSKESKETKETSDKKDTQKKSPTVRDHAKKTPTAKLKTYAENKNKPEKLRRVAKEELKRRGEDNQTDKKNVEKNMNFENFSEDYFQKALVDYADVIVINENFEVLLLLRAKNDSKYSNKYGLPGGHVESAEIYMEAALRELKEETGIEVERLEPCDSYKNEDGSTSHYYMIHCHSEEYNIILNSDEHVNYMWCPMHNLSKYDLIFDLANRIKSIMGINQTVLN